MTNRVFHQVPYLEWVFIPPMVHTGHTHPPDMPTPPGHAHPSGHIHPPQKGPGTRDAHPVMDRMTDTCENITFPQLRSFFGR